MALIDDMRWFKETFQRPIAAVTAGTPFSLDLLTALAVQETGGIWQLLRKKVGVDELLELCVGDSLDDDKGRRAFPKNKAALLAVPRGNEMFAIAHDALVRMAVHIKGYQAAAKNPNKFCRGYGIFQCDLQFFKTDPEYFLERRWRHFDIASSRCVQELRAAQSRIGLARRSTLTDQEQVHVAIAYNCGKFDPSKGLKQGYKSADGRFYGENIFDYLRLAQSVPNRTVREVPVAGPAKVAGARAAAKIRQTRTRPLRATAKRASRKPR